jgi:hypothetical protein
LASRLGNKEERTELRFGMRPVYFGSNTDALSPSSGDGVHCGRNVAEGTVDTVSQGAHACRRCERYQRNDKRVLDEILPIVFPNQKSKFCAALLESVLHRYYLHWVLEVIEGTRGLTDVCTRAPWALLLKLACDGIQFRGNVAKRTVDAVGQSTHTRGGGKGYKCNDERILNEILTVFTHQEILEPDREQPHFVLHDFLHELDSPLSG